MDKAISKNKLLAYLEWLEDEALFNSKHDINDKAKASHDECARIARMLSDILENDLQDLSYEEEKGKEE